MKLISALLLALSISMSAQAADVSQPEPSASTFEQVALGAAETVLDFVVPSAEAASRVPTGALTAAETDIEDTIDEVSAKGFTWMMYGVLAFAAIGLTRKALSKGGVK